MKPLSITNFVFQSGQRICDADITADILESGDVYGQYSFHQKNNKGEHFFYRDRLGVNKLFYGIDRKGRVKAHNYWLSLLQAGFEPEHIWSVPAGHKMILDVSGGLCQLDKVAPVVYGGSGLENEEACFRYFVPRIRDALHACFKSLSSILEGRDVYLSLSGGLDSTTIAALAKQYLGDFTAVTFSLSEAESEDMATAQRVAEDIGIKIHPIHISTSNAIEALDEVLKYGQDFRDFNVHCGLVNIELAKEISSYHKRLGRQGCPVLITGDVMNELMIDYHPEEYKGHTYYRLPRLHPEGLRRMLLTGLDAGDREVGIFHRYGIDTIQPYAWLVSYYTALPAALLVLPHAKQRLVFKIMGQCIPDYVYRRPKVRAQSASEDQGGGMLQACLEQGIDQSFLCQRFAEIYGLNVKQLHKYILNGQYRFTSQHKELSWL